MVKSRRNRQPRDWQNMTHERSHSSILRGAETVKVTKLTVQAQLKKAQKNKRKLEKNIRNHREKANKAGCEPYAKSWHEGAILQLEKRLVKTTISIMALMDKDEKQQQQYEEHKAKEKQVAEVAKARAAEVKERPAKYGKVNGFHPGEAGKGRVIEKVERLGTKRRVKRKYISEVKEIGQKRPSDTVKVNNPNRKGQVFLPRKKED